MKRFEFRLQRVLAWKQQRERLAELQLQKARMNWEAACTAVVAAEERIARAAADVAEAGKVGLLVQRLAYARHVGAMEITLQVARQQATRAEQELRLAMAARTRALVEVETLLQLRERQWQAYARDRARHEQEQFDALGLRRWRLGGGIPGGGERP